MAVAWVLVVAAALVNLIASWLVFRGAQMNGRTTREIKRSVEAIFGKQGGDR
jgi:hypothetical protein